MKLYVIEHLQGNNGVAQATQIQRMLARRLPCKYAYTKYLHRNIYAYIGGYYTAQF